MCKIASAGSQEAKKLEEVKRAFEKAYRETSSTHKNTKYMLSETFVNEVEQWYSDKELFEKKGGFFTVGRTSEALKSIGVKDYDITWDKSKIKKIMNDHEEMTIDVIKNVPNVLENPVVVMQSKTRLDSITLLGEVYANGEPVMVAMQLSPSGKSGRLLDYSKISSAYVRSNLQDLINTSDILYVEPNKKRTNNWLSALGLQLPVGLTKYGSISKVTYYEDAVKNEEFGRGAFVEALKKAGIELSKGQFSVE